MTRYAKAPTAKTARAPDATDEHRPAVKNPVLLDERLSQDEAVVNPNSTSDSDSDNSGVRYSAGAKKTGEDRGEDRGRFCVLRRSYAVGTPKGTRLHFRHKRK